MSRGLNPTETNYGAVAPTTAELLILAAAVGRSLLLLYNNGNQTVYLGETGVLSTTGFPLKPGQSIELHGTAEVYGITSTGTGDIRYLEEQNPLDT